MKISRCHLAQFANVLDGAALHEPGFFFHEIGKRVLPFAELPLLAGAELFVEERGGNAVERFSSG